jgi:hypothetical protein
MGPDRTTGETPLATRIPTKLAYIYFYAIDMAYTTPPCTNEFPKAYRRRLYSTLHAMAAVTRGAGEARITILQPNTNWPRVWNNLHSAWITEDMKSIWFTVIHDFIPTSERLSKIRLSDSNCCTRYGQLDTLQRRLTECNEGVDIWRWTHPRFAAILRTDPKHIPADWTIRPHFY